MLIKLAARTALVAGRRLSPDGGLASFWNSWLFGSLRGLGADE
jgi:hypothetical protein